VTQQIAVDRFRRQRPSARLPGQTWIGANFWSRAGGPLMWRQYDRELVRSELTVLRDHGVDLTRSFFYWPDFHPEEQRIDEAMVARYGDFLGLHVELGMRTVPTFIVGHMSGANWDPAWRAGRDLYRDVTLVERQAWFIREMTARFQSSSAVAAWLISNEMPIYGGGGGPMGDPTPPADHRDVRAWAALMVQAVRAGGATQPVSLGDGAWGIETSGRDNSYRIRDLAGLVDFLGPHTYPFSDDPVRQHLTAAFMCELCTTFGMPVVLEEFGVSTDFASDEATADYYRSLLYSTMLSGATGWVAWNNTDFDLPNQDPYRHHPFELHFGITDTHGEPKSALLELAAFRDVLTKIGFDECSRPDTATSILISSYLEADHPFINPQDRLTTHDTAFQAYISARTADLAPALVREVDEVATTALIIVPSYKALTAPTWHALQDAAAAGSTVFVSYSAGETFGQRGPWHPFFDEFFGVRRLLRYGLVDAVRDDIVHWTFTQAVGSINEGDSLTFTAGGNADGRAFLRLQPTSATVWANDAAGHPALLSREVGSGRIVLSTYPLEYFAARTPDVNPDDTTRLYSALSQIAGAEPVVTADDARVMTDHLVHADGRRFAVLINLSEAAFDVDVRAAAGISLRHLTGKALDSAVHLDPYGIHVLQL
jgi:endo-1,4-beta-mannosidase